MFTIKKTLTFDAAHHLHAYDGPCVNVHGHTYEVEVVIKGDTLNDEDMLVDFRDLKEFIKDRYDHTNLNGLEEFNNIDGINPTTENLAVDIWNVVDDYLIKETENQPHCSKVILKESEDNEVTFKPNHLV